MILPRVHTIRHVTLTLLFLQILPGCALYSGPGAPSLSRNWQSEFTRSEDVPTHVAQYARMVEDEQSAAAAPSTVGEAILTGMSVEPQQLDELAWQDTRPIGLLEVIHQALTNNEVIPVDSQFLSSTSPLYNAPQGVPSIYDMAIQSTGVAGSRGTVAATSDFVPVFTARSTYGQDNVIQNNLVAAGLPAGGVLENDTGNLQLSLQQQLPSGGRLSLEHNTTFDENNVATNLFPNLYQGQLAVEFNQPLWRGAGQLFTGIAGPIDLISQRAPSVDQGIVITRLNERLSEHQFQVALRQLIKDVADVYQDLNFAHRRYEIESQSRDAVQDLWESVQTKSEVGAGDGLAAESQAEESYYAAVARTKDALSEISLAENRLRRLTGTSIHDGLVLQPLPMEHDPLHVEDWEQSLAVAFSNRPELRESMLQIESLELQRAASTSLLMPRLDLVTNFHVNGFGDRPFNDSGRPTIRPDSYYQNLLQGGQAGWFAGFEFSVPLDQRQSRSLMHQLEHRLSKARAGLHAQKKEISHELWHAFQSVERWTDQIAENERRVAAVRRQVDALEAARPTERATVDQLVRAHATLATARTELSRVRTEYHKALSEIRFRRGTLLEDLQIAVSGSPTMSVPVIPEEPAAADDPLFDSTPFEDPAKEDLDPPLAANDVVL